MCRLDERIILPPHFLCRNTYGISIHREMSEGQELHPNEQLGHLGLRRKDRYEEKGYWDRGQGTFVDKLLKTSEAFW